MARRVSLAAALCFAVLYLIHSSWLAFVTPSHPPAERTDLPGARAAEATSVSRAGLSRSKSSYVHPVALAGILALALGSAAASGKRKDGLQNNFVACRAEGEDAGILSGLGSLKREEQEEAEDAEKNVVQFQQQGGFSVADDFFDNEINDKDLQEYITKDRPPEPEKKKGSGRQLVYTLRPSRSYVLYIAKKNAMKTWTKDGPDGKNIGCNEVQIAVKTEKIRNYVLHMREFPQDFTTRIHLVCAVASRRRMLDKLAWKDLDSYLNIRSELKIRHVYRMEALIGRLPAYKYAIENRPAAPGRKITNRLKKAKRRLTTRLAKQLKAGKSKAQIRMTGEKIKTRQWLAKAYDDTAYMLKRKPTTEYIDPLNLP
jgi:ribosomal protein S15